MVDLLEYLYFPIGSLSIGGVLKSIKYLFERIYFFTNFILNLPYVAISPRTNFLNHGVSRQDVHLDICLLVLAHCGFQYDYNLPTLLY